MANPRRTPGGILPGEPGPMPNRMPTTPVPKKPRIPGGRRTDPSRRGPYPPSPGGPADPFRRKQRMTELETNRSTWNQQIPQMIAGMQGNDWNVAMQALQQRYGQMPDFPVGREGVMPQDPRMSVMNWLSGQLQSGAFRPHDYFFLNALANRGGRFNWGGKLGG